MTPLLVFLLTNPQIATKLVRESIEVVKMVPELFEKSQGGLELTDEEIMAAVTSESYQERKKKMMEELGGKEEDSEKPESGPVDESL